MNSRNSNRAGNLYKPRPAGTLKKAMADLIEACGGLVRVADLLDVSTSQAQRYADGTEMKPSQIRILERESGQPIVTAFMAAEARHALVPLVFEAGSPLASDMARYGEQSSQLFARYCAAMADGRLSSQEAAELKEGILRVFGALGAMLPDLDAAMADGK